jgi:hypothetical protein
MSLFVTGVMERISAIKDGDRKPAGIGDGTAFSKFLPYRDC